MVTFLRNVKVWLQRKSLETPYLEESGGVVLQAVFVRAWNQSAVQTWQPRCANF